MHVSSVSANNGFTGTFDKSSKIDKELDHSDTKLKSIAFCYADYKYEKRRKNAQRLFYAVPLVGALSTGILTKGTAGMFGKEVTGLAAKTVNAIKGGGYWAFLLGAASLVGIGSRAVTKNSKNADHFKRNHPLLTLGAQIGACLAAISLLPKGAAKIYKAIKPEVIAKAGEGVGQIAEHINKIKPPKFLSSWGNAIATRTPESIKNLGKLLTAYAPDITLLTAVCASLKAFTGTTDDYSKTYLALKNRQLELAQAKIQELQKQRYEL